MAHPLISELQRRVDRLSTVFDLDALEVHGGDIEQIRRYYEDSRLGYRFAHSRDGAMHLALNPSGIFDKSGYLRQPSLVLERIADPAVNVLELACGNGYNLGLLAEHKPSHCFIGIDLVPDQVDRANASLGSFANATASVGDFQDLPFTDDSQDVVFAIESFCHATDLQRAFSEVYRVLRPGGLFVVIDAWRTEVYPTAPEIVRRAATSVELAMAVSNAVVLTDWIALAERCGLVAIEDCDLSAQIMPNLTHLEKGADKFLSHQRLASIARKCLPPLLIQNAIAGYLMPIVVALGIHTYRLHTLRRTS